MNDVPILALSAAPLPGGFIATYKVVLMLLFALPWLWVCAWVDKDTVRVRAPKVLWTGVIVAAGVVGLAAWMLVPMFFAGLGIYLVLVAAACGVYVIQRNTKVIPEARILTREHLTNLFQRTGAPLEPVTKLKAYDHLGKPVLAPKEGADNEEVKVYNTVQEILYDVIWRRASDADFKPSGEDLSVRYVIDGVVIRRPRLPRVEADPAIRFIKAIAGMDVEEKRRPQTGKISVDIAAKPVDINVTVAGSTSGQRMQLKVIQEAVRTDITQLGMDEKTLQRIQAINQAPRGLILVAARPGNGVTSTLYSLLRVQDAYTKLLVSVEANPEVDMENITQHKYDRPADMAGTLASALRHDPDIVMVDACPDAAGAAAVLKGAAEKKIFLGITAPDSFHALAQWVKLAGTRSAVEPLLAVLSQVLCRKLCPACREAYRPDPAVVRKANLPVKDATKFYRPPSKPLTDEKGNVIICATCQGSGYYGRTAAFELLELTDDLRQMIVSGANLTRIKAEARKNKMQYLQDVALRLVMEGVTSIEEVIRVTRTKQE